MTSEDPQFETKAADVIGLYLNPPAHAAVFCVDEKAALQALERLEPVLPLSPGRLERHGFEYFRHGTLSLYAASDTKTAEVPGETAARHTSAEFVAFLADICAHQRERKVRYGSSGDVLRSERERRRANLLGKGRNKLNLALDSDF